MDALGVDGRDIALIIALCAIAAGVLIWRDTRQAAIAIVRAAFAPEVVTPIVLLGAYGCGLVWLTQTFGLWDPSLTKATAYWFVTVILAGLYRSAGVADGTQPFRSLLTPPASVAAVASFVSGLFTFPWWLELIILVTLALAAVLASAARVRPGPGSGCATGVSKAIIALATLAILGRVALGLLGRWAGIDWSVIGREFALPIAFTAAAVPALYAVCIVAYFSRGLKIFRSSHTGRARECRVVAAVLLESRCRIGVLARIKPRCLDFIGRGETLEAARAECRFCLADGHPWHSPEDASPESKVPGK